MNQSSIGSILRHCREMEKDHGPDCIAEIPMYYISALCDEIERPEENPRKPKKSTYAEIRRDFGITFRGGIRN